MANIFHIERAANKVTIGTTGTLIEMTGRTTLTGICTLAAGLSFQRISCLQTDGVVMTGTLRGAYIDVSNGSTAATGTIRAMELKARTEAPGDTGNDVAVLEGLSISADSKGHSVTTMRAAEFILDGKTGGTITEAVGLRIANNLQANKATTSYGLQIYRDSFDYTYDISLSLGGHITGDSYVNQDLRTTASPQFAGALFTSAETTRILMISTAASPNRHSGISFKIAASNIACIGVDDDDDFLKIADGLAWNNSSENIATFDPVHHRVGINMVQPHTTLTVEGAITLQERAAREDNTAAYAQVYAKNDVPNTLWFVNDVGTEVRIAPQDLQVTASPTFAGFTKIGTATDYTEIESDGTIKFNGAATVWDDLQFTISDAKVPASNFPTWETFTTNTKEYSFAVDDYIDTKANETSHAWKLGTSGHVHLHVTTKAANSTGSNRYAKFTVYLGYCDTNETWQETSFTAEVTIPDGTSALQMFYLDMGNLTFTNYVLESEIKMRVSRIDATGGTEYAGNIFLTQAGIHFEHDTIGSRAETTK